MIQLLPVEEVSCLLAENGLVFALDRQGTRYPLAGTLTEQEKQLGPAQSFRLNRGEVVNIRYIEKIGPYSGNRLTIKLDGRAQPLITSTAQIADFRRWPEG